MSDRSLRIVDKFAPEAEPLRAAFDARFAEPRRTDRGRFVWDYWHVPGQYTALRTPAWEYFPRPLYERFHQRLVAWGRANLGCHDVSPPWLSVYVDGCEQRLHGDLPHGPWAFVFSLTRWRGRAFSGGETLLLHEHVLDYWADFRSVRAVEEPELVREVPAQFGRLVVFDPRVPHGVRMVRGVQDPRAGRLVIHGWFVQPRPFITGPLPVATLSARIDELSAQIGRDVGDLPLAGLLSVGFTVDRTGTVSAVRVLSDTTRVPAADERARRAVVRAWLRAITAWRFARQRAPSHVTLPLLFDVGTGSTP